jgi:hypothetical protein
MDTQGVGFGNRFLAIVDVELTVDVDRVSFHGFGGDEKLFGDLLVAQPLLRKGQNLELTPRQGFIQRLVY